jgi:eukaryotic-like serine/threonine-protein kinase
VKDRAANDRERLPRTDPDGMPRGDEAGELGRPGASGRDRIDAPVSPGTVVGRFIVHRALGMGGAGVVYAAHDPELDRTIALKILHSELADHPDSRARFVREAQALARVSHPNVIAVYDIGVADERTFIAMEYIAGRTFADWVASSRPSWPAILAVLLQAGRGLVAAHAAGLVHRDFKPGNLLVGKDGRVVVTDFGLARTVVEAEPPTREAPADPLARNRALASSITRTGTVQGTPAYMAPEQRQGSPGDTRSDQFSFCVTLHEALFGEHPFLSASSSSQASPVESTAERKDPLAERIPRAPSDARGVPLWVQRAIQRGLRWRPEERHPDMDSLLVALGRAPVLRRRPVQLGLALGAAGIAGAIALGLAVPQDSREESCSGGHRQLSAVWNPSVAAQVRAAFMATGRSHAAASAARVAEQVEGHIGGWAQMHRSTCLATLRGEQSPELLDRRMACLDRRLAQVGALVDLFVHRTDGELVDGALEVVADLEPLTTCADSTALLARAALPVDPVRRARVSELERQTDRADLERQAGRPAAAAEGARAVLDAERGLDDAPLAARAGRVLGRSLEDMGQPAQAREAMMRANRLAERAGDARLGAHLLIDLVFVVGVREQRHAEAHLLTELAEGALESSELRGDQAMRARMLEALGGLANDEGHGDRAIELLTELLAIRRRSSASPIEVARTESMLGNALASTGRSREARAHYLEALAIRRRVLGEDHPDTANTHGNLGATYMEVEGNAAEARKHYLIQLATLQRIPTHRAYPSLLSNLGGLESIVGNYDKAREYHQAALEVRRRQLGPDHPAVATSLYNLGDVFAEIGDIGQALSLHRQALAIREKRLGSEHPSYALSLAAIGEDLRRSGRPREAVTYLERALAIQTPRLGESYVVGFTLSYLGRALLDLGRRRDALPKLERAMTLIPPAQSERAHTAFALARALDPGGPRSARTRALAEQALEIFTALRATRDRDRVAAYLVSRRVGRARARADR